MDPSVRALVNRLDDRLGRLSSQMEELHENVRQVVVVAEADPEMALTKARKVLESVLRRVWEHFIPNEPIGTRPLEEILQRLQKNGYLPRKQAAYAIAVKELGNVGTHVHDEKVDKADVVQALSPLISVLEWYFEQDWVEGAAAVRSGGQDSPHGPGHDDEHSGPGPSPKPRHLVRVAVASGVMLTLIAIAGSIAFFRGADVPPPVEASPRSDQKPIEGGVNTETSPRSDEEQIQGRWEQVELASSKTAKKKGRPNSVVWWFRGKRLTIHFVHQDGTTYDQNGTFSLSEGVPRKLFDFSTTRPDGSPMEYLGIYELNGDSLKICYWVRLDPNNPDFKRPDSFAAGPGTNRIYVRLRRPRK